MQRIVREQKKTLVMVTHDDHLETYADRVFHIRDGKILKIEDNRKTEQREEMTKRDDKIKQYSNGWQKIKTDKNRKKKRKRRRRKTCKEQ